MPAAHPVALRQDLVDLICQGIPEAEAARRVGISRTAARNIARRWRETGSLQPGGPPRYSREERERLIFLLCQGNSLREAARLAGIREAAARSIARIWRETGQVFPADTIAITFRQTGKFRWKRHPSAPAHVKPSRKFGPFLDKWLHERIAETPNITICALRRGMAAMQIPMSKATISSRLSVLGYIAEPLQS